MIDRKVKLSKESLTSLIKRKIQEANPQYKDIPWDEFDLHFEQGIMNTEEGVKKAKVYLKPKTRKYKTQDPKGIPFTYSVLPGEEFFMEYLSIPDNSISEYVTDNVPYLNSLGLKVEASKPVVDSNTGFKYTDYFVLPKVNKIPTDDDYVLDLLYLTKYEGYDKPALFRYRVIDEPDVNYFKQFTHLLDLRKYAFALVDEYMNIILQKINYYKFVANYNTSSKGYTFKSPYSYLTLYNSDLFNEGKEPMDKTKLNGIAYTNGYFNHPLIHILFTLGSSPNETDIGNGRGNYQYSKLNDKYVSKDSLQQHLEVKHHFLYWTYNYLVSGLEGTIKETDVDYEKDFNYNNFGGADGYRKYVIDLATGTLWSTTRYYHQGTPTTQNRNTKTYNTIGSVLPIINGNFRVNLLNRAKELYLATPVGKLTTDIGYRKTDLFVGNTL